MTDIKGRVAVVTGGGSGIGGGLTRALAAEGASVVVADINEVNAAKVAADIRDMGGRAASVACDVSDRASVHAMKAEANRLFGTVSLLFANAGVTLFKPLVDMTDDEIDWVIQVDLMGVFNCLRSFIPDMIASHDGHIMATSSFAGLFCSRIDRHGSYVAAKAGVLGLMLSLRRELEPHGIGSTVLCPGAVRTGIRDSFRNRPARYGGPSDRTAHVPETDAWLTQRTPDEVAQMVLQAVQKNRAVVITHGRDKQAYLESIEPILSAFDDALEFDRSRM